MSVYFLQVLIMTLVSVIFFYLEKLNRKFNFLYGILTFIYLFCILGFRSILVGTDTRIYYNSFLNQNNSLIYLENDFSGRVVYDFISKTVFKYSGGDYHVFIIIISFLILISIFISIKVYFGYFNHLSIMLYMYLCFYLNSFNTSRQALAIALTLLSLVLVLKSHTRIAFFISIIAIGIHSTAIIILLFFFFNRIALNQKKILINILLITLGLFSFDILIDFFVRLFPHYSIYFQKSSMYEIFSSTNILRIVIFTLVSLAGFIVINYNSKKIGKEFYFLLLICLIGNIMYIFFSSSLLYTRIAQYFTIPYIIFIPVLFINLNNCKINKYLKFIYKITILVLSILLIIYSISINSGEVVPYSFYR